MGSYAATGGFSQTAALDSATLVKIRSGKGSSAGYRVTNHGAGTVLIREVRTGTTAPTLSDVLTDRKTSFPELPAHEYLESGGRDVDVYACTTAGTAKVNVEDLEVH
jgi:hypothetical protein